METYKCCKCYFRIFKDEIEGETYFKYGDNIYCDTCNEYLIDDYIFIIKVKEIINNEILQEYEKISNIKLLIDYLK